MARQRKKSEIHAGELNLTAMIDVAFQLLNFFIITSHPVDVFTHLNVFRPSPEPPKKDQPPPLPENMIRIQIFSDGYSINERPVTVKMLEGLARRGWRIWTRSRPCSSSARAIPSTATREHSGSLRQSPTRQPFRGERGRWGSLTP